MIDDFTVGKCDEDSGDDAQKCKDYVKNFENIPLGECAELGLEFDCAGIRTIGLFCLQC